MSTPDPSARRPNFDTIARHCADPHNRKPSEKVNFDTIARPYRLLEYLTFGPVLHRTRTRLLPGLAAFRRALVLGDGDGRFTAAMLAAHPHLHADAVDLSPAMLALLTRRTASAHPTAAGRLRTLCADARELDLPTRLPSSPPYDLVVAHFFLDCLTQPELDALAHRLEPHLAPNAAWLVSDFRIPPSGPLRLPARALVRSLYAGFRLLTGLRTTRLPDHAATLRAARFTLTAHHRLLGGILTTELWRR